MPDFVNKGGHGAGAEWGKGKEGLEDEIEWGM